jgi:hypothetical protein
LPVPMKPTNVMLRISQIRHLFRKKDSVKNF